APRSGHSSAVGAGHSAGASVGAKVDPNMNSGPQGRTYQASSKDRPRMRGGQKGPGPGALQSRTGYGGPFLCATAVPAVGGQRPRPTFAAPPRLEQPWHSRGL